MRNLKLTEIKWLGKSTQPVKSRAGMSNAKFHTLSSFVVPVTLKDWAWAQGWIIDTDSNSPRSAQLLTSHPHSFRWLWGIQPGGHYSLPTCFGAKSHRETGKIRWFRHWQLWLRVYVSSAILPSLPGLLPFFSLAVFPTYLFCLCKHTSFIMWLKKCYLALVSAGVTDVPSLAGTVLVLAPWVPHLEKLLSQAK